MNKSNAFYNLTILFITLTTIITSCYTKEANKITISEYIEVVEADITTCINMVFPKEQITALKTNPERRKKIIENLQSTFAVAQVAQEAGLDKGEEFQKHLSSGLIRLLATEFSEHYTNYQINHADIELYANTHKNDFDSELNFLNYHPEDGQVIEDSKLKWSELHLRAEMGRQKGLDKEAMFQRKYRLLRADVLANMFLKKTEAQYKIKDSDIETYYSQHPETAPEKIKQHMSALILRIHSGENFEKIANEINEDDTKGKGGDLDWFSLGTMAPELEKAALSLKPNQIYQEPVETEYGYHIVRFIARRPSSTGKEEIRIKHIFVSTKQAMSVLSKIMKESIERDIEEAKSKFPVRAPVDITIN